MHPFASQILTSSQVRWLIGPSPCHHTVWDTPEHTPPHLCEGRPSVYRTVIILHRFYAIIIMNDWTWLDSFSLAEVAALLLLSLRLTATWSSMYNKFLWHWKNGANFCKTAAIIFISSLFYNVTIAGSIIYQVKAELKSGEYFTTCSITWTVFMFLFSPHNQDFSYLN